MVWHRLAGRPGTASSRRCTRRGYYKDWSKDPELGTTTTRPRPSRCSRTEAGSPGDGGTCTKNGVKAEFTLDVLSNTRRTRDGAADQGRRKAIGIDINLEVVTEDAINAQIYASTSSKKPEDKGKYEPTYDAFKWGWGGDLATPDYNFEVMNCAN